MRGNVGMAKIGAARFDYRDPYHAAVSLSWPAFVLTLLLVWLVINLVFASLYVASPGDVVNARPGSFSDVCIFSIETLATVGDGVMAPNSLYGHIISATEIVTGTAFTAIVTGLLFVRFSRPKAKILFSEQAVITTYNGQPTLMARLVNGRLTPMTSANIRLFILLAERTEEGEWYRRVHDVALMQSHLPLFIMPWTVMHRIDEASPFHGCDAETLPDMDIRLFLTVEAHDSALATMVQDMKDYNASQIRFGMRFANSISTDEDGNITADLSRISLLEPDNMPSPDPS